MRRRVNEGVRRCLAERLRELRKEHRFSQERLGELAGLSGKFIGEVERAEKSISIDSLYRIAHALNTPLALITAPIDRRRHIHPLVPKIMTLIDSHRSESARRAYEAIRALLRAEA